MVTPKVCRVYGCCCADDPGAAGTARCRVPNRRTCSSTARYTRSAERRVRRGRTRRGPPSRAAGPAPRPPPDRQVRRTAAPPTRNARAARAEPLAEFAGRRIELAAADRVEAIVHHAAIETRHVAVDRDRVGGPSVENPGGSSSRARAIGRLLHTGGTPPSAPARSTSQIAVRLVNRLPAVPRLVRVAGQQPHSARVAEWHPPSAACEVRVPSGNQSSARTTGRRPPGAR